MHGLWGQLCEVGLASIGSAAPASVGVFFVAKKAVGDAPAKLRLIFDTRLLNAHFEAPSYTQLPTPAAWSSLRVPAEHSLALAQCDVDYAFYRLKAPPGMSELFRLPPVELDFFRQLYPQHALDVTGKTGTPRLLALAL